MICGFSKEFSCAEHKRTRDSSGMIAINYGPLKAYLGGPYTCLAALSRTLICEMYVDVL